MCKQLVHHNIYADINFYKRNRTRVALIPPEGFSASFLTQTWNVGVFVGWPFHSEPPHADVTQARRF